MNKRASLSDWRVARAMTLRYAVALVLVAMLSTAAWFSLHLVISEQKSTAAIVNVSGRQRMLSQRTALFSVLLVNAPQADRSRLRGKLQEAIDLMERSHRGLTHGDREIGLPPTMSLATHALYFDGPDALDGQVKTYIQAVRELLSLEDNALTTASPQLQYITRAAPAKLVATLDRMVSQYQSEGESSVKRLQNIETMFWMFTLLLLALEALLIFRPFVNHVRAIIFKLQRATEELQLSHAHLEETVSQRTAELEIKNNALRANELLLSEAQVLARLGSWKVVFGVDDAHDVWEVSSELRQLFGQNGEVAIKMPTGFELVPDEDREVTRCLWADAKAGSGPTQWEHRIVLNGEIRWIYVTSHFVFDGDGKAVEARGTCQDVTERKNIEIALSKALATARTFSAAMDDVPSYICMKDLNRHYTYANKITLELFKCSADDLIGSDDARFFPPATAERLKQVDDRVLQNGETTSELIEVPMGDGEQRVYLEVKHPIYDEGGKISGLCGISTDISEHIRLEKALRKGENLFHNYFDLSQIGMAITSTDCQWLNVNNCLVEMLGYSKEELNGLTWVTLTHPDDLEADMGQFRRLLAGEIERYEMDKRFIHKLGRVVYTHLTVSCQRNPEGSVDYVIASVADITDRKLMEDQVRQLAFYDTLTRLPNRRVLDDRLAQAMAASKRSGCYGALLFLDLDNFKPLNDLHGHDAGDLLLIEVGRRLGHCVREVDTVVRFGGDEFVVLLNELDADKAESVTQATRVAEKIRTTLAEPYHLNILHQDHSGISMSHRCTATIGVTLFSGHDATKEDILKFADIAMYRAKADGRNLIRFYDPKA